MHLSTKLSVLLLATVTIPVVAVAAFKSPSALLASIHFKGKPLNVSYEAHVTGEEFYASAWLKGQVQSGTDAKSLKANLRMTVDVAGKGSDVMRIKAEIRAIDGVAYVFVVSGTDLPSLKVGAIDVGMKNNRWYALPIKETTTKKLAAEGMSEEEAKQILQTLIDALFGMTAQTNGNIVTYSLKPKTTAATELAAAIKTINAEQSSISKDVSTADIRQYLEKLNLHIKVVTTTKDEPKQVKFYASYTENSFPLSVVVQGTTAPRMLPVSVSKPPASLTITSDGAASDSPSTTRNAQRRADVNTILNASYQYAIDNNANLPKGIPIDTSIEICGSGSTNCAGRLNLDILTGTYLVKIPRDPTSKALNETRYFISQDRTGHLTVTAPDAEDGVTISVTR